MTDIRTSNEKVAGCILSEAIDCCRSWEPEVRLIGNVRAIDLRDLLLELWTYRNAHEPPVAPMSHEELTAICKRFVVEGYNGDYLEDDGFHLAREVEGLTLNRCGASQPPVPEHDPALCEANERLATIMTGAAGKHAERVVELEAEVSTLREHLAEQNRLLSLNCREVERLKTGTENLSWYEGEPDKQVIADMSRLKREGKL